MACGSGERPSATVSWSSTRSTPWTSSVTGCSTWRRVFISRKKKRSAGLVVEELDGAGAEVVDRRRSGAGRLVQGGARRVGRRGAGDSSTTFWWRRWIEQSRSPSTSTPASWPTTCTSTWRPRSTYGSTKTVPSPNALTRLGPGRVHLGAEVGERRGRSASRGRRRPRTPSPAGAGRLPRGFGGSLEHRVRRPCASASWRRTLEPIRSIDSGDGPTQVRPASITARAKSAFSERKP